MTHQGTGTPRIVVIVASEGGVGAVCEIVGALPGTFNVPIVVVQHRSANRTSLLTKVLSRCTSLRVKDIHGGERPMPGVVYVAPQNRHVCISPTGRFNLFDGARINHVASSGDPLFVSAAKFYGAGVVAGVLTGNDGDGAAGVLAVKEALGTVFVQDAGSSIKFTMPRSAIETGAVDVVLPLSEIGPWLTHFARNADAAESPSG